jgi:hypothetical protein
MDVYLSSCVPAFIDTGYVPDLLEAIFFYALTVG